MRRLIGGFACCVALSAGAAHAHSCFTYTPDTPDWWSVTLGRYDGTQPSIPDGAFVVYGDYEKVQDLPFQHELEHADRNERNFIGTKYISAQVEYTYRQSIRFSGVRFTSLGPAPFETLKTVVTVISEDYFQTTIPIGQDFVGLMTPDGGLFRIKPDFCLEYRSLS